MDAEELIKELKNLTGYGDIKISIHGVWHDIQSVDLEVIEDYDENGDITDETCIPVLTAKEM